MPGQSSPSGRADGTPATVPAAWFSARTRPGDTAAGRFRDWSRIIGHAFGTQQAQPLRDPDDFHGHFRHARLGAYAVSTIAAGPEDVFHTAGNAPDHEPHYHLNFLAAGTGGPVRQGGAQSLLEPGGFVLTDANRDYSFRFEGAMELLVLHLPPARLRTAFPQPARAAGIAVPGNLPESAPLRALLDNLAASPAGGTASTHFLAGAAVDTALAGLIRVLGEDAGQSIRDAHMGRVRAHIDANLSDPALTPASIAAAVHLSLRQLHSVFEPGGVTVAKYLRTRRLEEAVLLLGDPRLRAVSISDIGARVGFTDASHFGRAFRQAYRTSPGRFRAARDLRQSPRPHSAAAPAGQTDRTVVTPACAGDH